MAKFKVGDRARLVKVRKGAPNKCGLKVGDVVVIVDSGEVVASGFVGEYAVSSDASTMRKAWVMGWQLEPLTPDLGSWEEIERLTKWKPQGVTA